MIPLVRLLNRARSTVRIATPGESHDPARHARLSTVRHLNVWIEPVIVGECARLMQGCGVRQGRSLPMDERYPSLTWLDPARDTQLVRTHRDRTAGQGRARLIAICPSASVQSAPSPAGSIAGASPVSGSLASGGQIDCFRLDLARARCAQGPQTGDDCLKFGACADPWHGLVQHAVQSDTHVGQALDT